MASIWFSAAVSNTKPSMDPAMEHISTEDMGRSPNVSEKKIKSTRKKTDDETRCKRSSKKSGKTKVAPEDPSRTVPGGQPDKRNNKKSRSTEDHPPKTSGKKTAEEKRKKKKSRNIGQGWEAAPQFIKEVEKAFGETGKHAAVSAFLSNSIGWVSGPDNNSGPPTWKKYPGQSANSADSEVIKTPIVGPSLPVTYPSRPTTIHAKRRRLRDPFKKRRKTSSPPTEPANYPRPETPTKHWDEKKKWPADTSILPFTIPLASIAHLGNIRNPAVRKRCAVDKEEHPRIKRCLMCYRDAKPKLACLQCHQAWYCSEACKADDESSHNLLCASFGPKGLFTDRWRQSQDHCRAMVWPARSKMPHLRWVHIHHSSFRRSALDSNTNSNTEENPLVWGPSLSFHDPEFWDFAKELPKEQFRDEPFFRLGCMNESSALKYRILGGGLFILEWNIPLSADLPHTWVNKSITSLGAPGHIWYWSGPQMIIGVDVEGSHRSTTGLRLRDLTPRDLRYVVDYFQLNSRNPVLTDPFIRMPLKYKCAGLKLTDTTQPLAQVMGVPLNRKIEEVFIPRNIPFKRLEGWSAFCAGLKLNWIFREALCHGPEFDWLYQRDPTGTLLSGAFRGIYIAPELPTDRKPKLSSLLSNGDGIVVAHRTGGSIHPHHLRALIEYVGWRTPVCMDLEERAELEERTKDLLAAGRQGFERYWTYYRQKERLTGVANIPGPYELEEKWKDEEIVVGRGVWKAYAWLRLVALFKKLESTPWDGQDG